MVQARDSLLTYEDGLHCSVSSGWEASANTTDADWKASRQFIPGPCSFLFASFYFCEQTTRPANWAHFGRVCRVIMQDMFWSLYDGMKWKDVQLHIGRVAWKGEQWQTYGSTVFRQRNGSCMSAMIFKIPSDVQAHLASRKDVYVTSRKNSIRNVRLTWHRRPQPSLL